MQFVFSKMRMLIRCFGAVAIVASAFGQDPWGLLAERDLRRMEQVIREDHPGPVDATNLPFRGLLAKSFEQALERGRKVNSFAAYTAILRWFTGRFEDDQLQVSFAIQPINVEWTGFSLTYRALTMHGTWMDPVPRSLAYPWESRSTTGTASPFFDFAICS